MCRRRSHRPPPPPRRARDRSAWRAPRRGAAEDGHGCGSRPQPRWSASSPPVDASSKPADNGVAESLERFTERVAVLAEAVDGLRNQLAEHSRQVAGLATNVFDRLGTLQEATEEVERVRAVLEEQPRG